MSTVTFQEFGTNKNIVDQILFQGQRLRNAMVQSILNNDPFSSDLFSSSTSSLKKTASVSQEDKEIFSAYLRGDQLSKSDEKKALESFRNMSNTELSEYASKTACGCSTCRTYQKTLVESESIPPLSLNTARSFRLNSDVQNSGNNESPQETPTHQYLKYVDSLKICVHSLNLTQEGIRKINGSKIDKHIELPVGHNHTYFIEYSLPEILLSKGFKSRGKVDSGLNLDNHVRMCSKRLYNKAIYFKQISFHDIKPLDMMNLDSLAIKFEASCRTSKQKNSNFLGVAKFRMSAFENTKYLTSNQELMLLLDEKTPIVLGSIKVSLQLGCGRLYFGKDFTEAIASNKENNVVLPESLYDSDEKAQVLPTSQSEATTSVSLQTVIQQNEPKKAVVKSPQKPKNEPIRRFPIKSVGAQKNFVAKPAAPVEQKLTTTEKQEVLFGFIYVSEAHAFDKTCDTYFTCQPFSQDDVFYSRLVYNSSNPVYNFQETIPFVYDESFLNRLRDNCMVFEFWEKREESSSILGICKIPLQQLYVAYRNPVIVKYLLTNEVPVICSDWWEPICDPVTGKIYGQAQILIALGSENQINNLKLKRGFTSDTVNAKYPKVTRKVPTLKTPIVKLDEKTCNSRSKPQKTVKDKSVQSEFTMEGPSEEKQNNNPTSKDVLETFLTKFMEKQKVCVENGTNTEDLVTDSSGNEVAPKPALKKTSDLLASLEKALLVESKPEPEKEAYFKAHIVIDSAMHLPSRKKCKSKKSKGRNSKVEEILPSTYVTFETAPGSELKITPIAQRTTNPVWDYRCDVSLPTDLIFNSQKRLIFKVWRKCNGNSVLPNLQADLVLGFAALDLTVFKAGLPTVQGWFNINDLSGKCNGQIKINITPLENVSKLGSTSDGCGSHITNLFNNDVTLGENAEKTDEPSELLSRALKRKFIELDEITQRLRLRLSTVTNDEGDASNDDLADEFERDINTLCVEDDYDMINFESIDPDKKESSNIGLLDIQESTNSQNSALLQFSESHSSKQTNGCSDATKTSNDMMGLTIEVDNLVDCTDKRGGISILDKQLIEGKQRISSLLEKLSLITQSDADAFSNRYVSGCSVSNQEATESNDILRELGIDSGVKLDPDCIINPLLFQELCNASLESTPPLLSERSESIRDASTSSSSNTSSTTQLSRAAPDGAGNDLPSSQKSS